MDNFMLNVKKQLTFLKLHFRVYKILYTPLKKGEEEIKYPRGGEGKEKGKGKGKEKGKEKEKEKRKEKGEKKGGNARKRGRNKQRKKGRVTAEKREGLGRGKIGRGKRWK